MPSPDIITPSQPVWHQETPEFSVVPDARSDEDIANPSVDLICQVYLQASQDVATRPLGEGAQGSPRGPGGPG